MIFIVDRSSGRSLVKHLEIAIVEMVESRLCLPRIYLKLTDGPDSLVGRRDGFFDHLVPSHGLSRLALRGWTGAGFS